MLLLVLLLLLKPFKGGDIELTNNGEFELVWLPGENAALEFNDFVGVVWYMSYGLVDRFV